VNSTRPFSPALALAWTITFVFVMQLLGSLLLKVNPRAIDDIVSLAALEAVSALLLAAAILYLHGKEAPLSVSLGLRPTHAAIPFLAMLLGFTVHFPAEAADIAIQHFYPNSAADLQREAALLTAPTLLGRAMVLFFVACVGPLVEEILFRGALFGALRRFRSLTTTTVVIALCFMLAHPQPSKWPAIAIVAFVITYVRAVSGSLLPTIAMHVVFNAITGVAFAMGQTFDPAARQVDVVPTVAFTAVTGLLLFGIRYIATRAASARRARAEDAE
jgi:membrane protease YdiL (CAAX protease family)